MRALLRRSELPVTGAVLLSLFALLQVAGTESSGPVEPFPRVGPELELTDQGDPFYTLLLALLATAPLALVRTRLMPVAAVVTAANALTLAAGVVPTVAAYVAGVIVTFLVARHRTQRDWLLLLVPFATYLAFPVGAVGDNAGANLALLILVTLGGLAGSTARARSEEAARRESEEHLAGSLLENAARGERARIARELHDVVAHHISMISIQAETARLTTPGMPPEGAKRLTAIGETAREALSEMRRLLGVLREDADPIPPRAPQPGLAQLADLVDETRDTAGGASTRLIVRGQVVPLEPGLELTAYRIVQEALTNSRRHAPGAAVDVEVEYADSALLVSVRDNGPGLSPDKPATDGHGLLGMQERAAMVGGTIRVESGRTGFLVEATLPLVRAGLS